MTNASPPSILTTSPSVDLLDRDPPSPPRSSSADDPVAGGRRTLLPAETPRNVARNVTIGRLKTTSVPVRPTIARRSAARCLARPPSLPARRAPQRRLGARGRRRRRQRNARRSRRRADAAQSSQPDGRRRDRSAAMRPGAPDGRRRRQAGQADCLARSGCSSPDSYISREDVAAADEFTVDVELRNRRPVRVLLDALADVRILQHVTL